MKKRTREIVNALSSLASEALAIKACSECRTETRSPGLRVSALSADTTEMFMYGDIGASWYGDGVGASAVAETLGGITTANLHVRLNSNGGDVFEGVAIHSLLQRHGATVTVFVDGIAASAASFIAMAGDRIVIARNAFMMIHDASTLAMGNAADLRTTADLLEKVSGSIADMYAERAGDEPEDWRTRMLAETWYTGQEAVEIGLADEIVEPTETSAKLVRDALISNRYRNAPPAPPAPELPEIVEPEPEIFVDVLGRELAYAMLADSFK